MWREARPEGMNVIGLLSAALQQLPLLAVAAAFLALFWPTFGWMAERFNAPDSFYSHGWLVPLASAWLVWQRRGTLARLALRPAYGGLLLLVPAVILHLLAVWSRLHVVSGLMVIAAVSGLVWTCWGRDALRSLRFPLAFLLFMVPLPGILLIGISFHLKLAAASLATTLLQLAGIPAAQEGSIIRLPHLTMLVDETCSGLRSLLSLVALATLWTSMFPTGTVLWRKLAVVAASIPISLAANMVRILLLTVLALVWGRAAAEGFLHYGSGIVVFGVALAALAWLGRLLGKAAGR
jgi:exosortase